jgi:hypothetical protein
MTASDQEPIFVRIIEIPPVRMARSGGKDLDAFDKWWSDLADQDRYSLFPRDFMWFNPRLENLEWLYALPEGADDSGGYETFDFPGGLYAVTACKDAEEEIERTSKLLHEWVGKSGTFEESSEANDPRYPRYEMGHVITPKNAKEMIGYHQMDLFVPVVLRKG